VSRPTTVALQMTRPLITAGDLRGEPRGGVGCFSCVWLIRAEESWEMPHIWWYECGERPQNESLRGFPWKVTKCKLREAK